LKVTFFTICSNNYLGQAKTLGDSIVKYYPDAKFVIGLVDHKDDKIDYSFFNGMEILTFDSLGFSVFEEMLQRYNVIEFNTAVKPYYFDYLWNNYGKSSPIIYLDPDILIYRPLDHVLDALNYNSIILTPMFCKVPLKTSLDELVALRHGMFNLGFIAIKYTEQSKRFIEWWKERLRTHCLIDKPRGIFVDQKWIDLVPLLFEEVYILKHLGYNMAWWNFSERKIIDFGTHFSVNSEDQSLYFFHFSGFKPESNSITGRSSEKQFSYEFRPELDRLGKEYEKLLIHNRYQFFNKLKPKLKFYEPVIRRKTKLKIFVKKIVNKIFFF
jgi:hypothetical protein